MSKVTPEAVLAIIKDAACFDGAVKPEMTFVDLEMDSLDAVELAIAIEDKFDIDFLVTSDDWNEDTTVDQVVKDVLSALEKAEA